MVTLDLDTHDRHVWLGNLQILKRYYLNSF